VHRLELADSVDALISYSHSFRCHPDVHLQLCRTYCPFTIVFQDDGSYAVSSFCFVQVIKFICWLTSTYTWVTVIFDFGKSNR